MEGNVEVTCWTLDFHKVGPTAPWLQMCESLPENVEGRNPKAILISSNPKEMEKIAIHEVLSLLRQDD